MICIILLLKMEMIIKTVNDKNENNENDYINFIDFIIPNHNISITVRDTILR